MSIVQLLKKIFLFFLILKIGSISALESDSSRIEALEKELEELREELYQVVLAQSGVSANPDVTGGEWFISVAPVYWHERTNGTTFAYSNHTLDVEFPLKGRTKDIDFNWNWGICVGGGRNVGYDKWDISSTFIYYSNHASGVASSGQSSTLIPLRGGVITQAGVSHAKSTYALDFYNLDVDVGRHYYVSSRFSLRPFVGVKTAWIDQRQVIRYTGGALAQNTASVKDYCDYWGLGVKGGALSRWHLGYGWNLEGGIGGAFLYGYFDIEHKENISLDPYDSIKIEDDKHRFVPVVQWRLGLSWGSYFNRRRNYVDIAIAYEGMYWWRQNQMINIYEYSALRYNNFSEDLSMHGLTYSIKLYF